MKVHVLEATGRGRYRVALHTPMPVGNNGASVTWKAAYLAAGLATTILTVGANPGQTTQVEHDAILAGDTIEIVAQMEYGSGGGNAAAVTAMADALISEALAVLQARLQYYGYTQVA